MRAASVWTLGFEMISGSTLKAPEDVALAIFRVLADAITHAFARCSLTAAVLAHVGFELAVFDVW